MLYPFCCKKILNFGDNSKVCVVVFLQSGLLVVHVPSPQQGASRCFESKWQSLRISLLQGLEWRRMASSWGLCCELVDAPGGLCGDVAFSLAPRSLFIGLPTPQPPPARVAIFAHCSAMSHWKIFLLWSSERQALGWGVKKEREIKGGIQVTGLAWDGENRPLKSLEKTHCCSGQVLTSNSDDSVIFLSC